MENPESEVASVEKVVVESVVEVPVVAEPKVTEPKVEEPKVEEPKVEEPKIDMLNVFARFLEYFSCTTSVSISVEKPGDVPKVVEETVVAETKAEPKEVVKAEPKEEAKVEIPCVIS
jgi:prolactin regulatory element-binding protein